MKFKGEERTYVDDQSVDVQGVPENSVFPQSLPALSMKQNFEVVKVETLLFGLSLLAAYCYCRGRGYKILN